MFTIAECQNSFNTVLASRYPSLISQVKSQVQKLNEIGDVVTKNQNSLEEILALIRDGKRNEAPGPNRPTRKRGAEETNNGNNPSDAEMSDCELEVTADPCDLHISTTASPAGISQQHHLANQTPRMPALDERYQRGSWKTTAKKK